MFWYRVSSIKGCFDREFIRSKPKVRFRVNDDKNHSFQSVQIKTIKVLLLYID